MNDADRWIYFDGPEPEHIRPFLDALRDLPPATPEDKERAIRRFLATLDATLSRREEPAGAEEGRASDAPGAPFAPSVPIAPLDVERRRAEDGATVRSPKLDDRRDASPPEESSASEAPFEARGPPPMFRGGLGMLGRALPMFRRQLGSLLSCPAPASARYRRSMAGRMPTSDHHALPGVRGRGRPSRLFSAAASCTTRALSAHPGGRWARAPRLRRRGCVATGKAPRRLDNLDARLETLKPQAKLILVGIYLRK
jgi:hypothetical protein